MSQNENELKNEEEKDNNEEENNQEINMDEKEVNKEINIDEKEENKEKEIKFKKGDLNDDQLDNINCEILKEDYPEYDLSFKVIVIGDSGI